MPEEIEVDAEQLRGAIEQELEREGGAFLRWISLSTAILAVLAAVGSLRAGATINEALLLKTEATQLQALASDQWSYYQAKGIKGAIAQGSVAVWQAAGKPVPSALSAQVTRYVTEQDDIRRKAGELEHQRDEKGHEATLLVEQHHHYATAVALFLIAIALGAIAALTRVRLAWFASLLTGAIGVVALALPWLRGP
jgi:hypothetical protein